MKITRIEIEDFRAFPGPATFIFDLEGKNLLVYGENGSGKSSLFRALLEFFNLDPRAKPFANHKNIFSDPTLADGRITVHFEGGSSGAWTYGGQRALGDPTVAETALRIGCIDYRALLKTNFAHSGDTVNLFDLAVTALLAHYPVPTTGGRTTTIGKLWQRVRDSKPRNHHKGNLQRAFNSVNEFNQALEPVLPPLTEKLRELLQDFPGCKFDLSLDFPKVLYDEHSRIYTQSELNLRLAFGGKPIPGHQHFLNEARLTAIALATYFAGLLVSIPAPPPGAIAY